MSPDVQTPKRGKSSQFCAARPADGLSTHAWVLGLFGAAAFTTFLCALLVIVTESGVVIAGVVFQILTMVIGLIVVKIGSRRPVPVVSGIGLITASHALLFVARPLYVAMAADGVNHFTGVEYGGAYLPTMGLAAAGFLSICLGYSIARRDDRYVAEPPLIRPIGDSDWRSLKPWMWVMAGIGVALWAVQIQSMGWSNYWSTTLAGRTDEYWDVARNTSGYVLAGSRFALGVALLACVQQLVRGRKLAAIFASSSVIVLMLPLLASGSRTGFLPVVFFFLFFIRRWRPGMLSRRAVVILGTVIFFLGFIAPRLWRDRAHSATDIGGAIAGAFSPSAFVDQFLGGLDSAMLDSFLLQVEAQSTGALPLSAGQTYLESLSSFVPRSWWPGKPLSVDQYLDSVLLPEYFARKIGIAFGFYSEPYLNFGLVGVVVVSFAFGVVLGSLVKRSERSTSILMTFWSSLFAGFGLVLMRGSLSFDLQRLMMLALPVMAALALSRLLTPADRRWSRGRRVGRSFARSSHRMSPHCRPAGQIKEGARTA